MFPYRICASYGESCFIICIIHTVSETESRFWCRFNLKILFVENKIKNMGVLYPPMLYFIKKYFSSFNVTWYCLSSQLLTEKDVIHGIRTRMPDPSSEKELVQEWRLVAESFLRVLHCSVMKGEHYSHCAAGLWHGGSIGALRNASVRAVPQCLPSTYVYRLRLRSVACWLIKTFSCNHNPEPPDETSFAGAPLITFVMLLTRNGKHCEGSNSRWGQSSCQTHHYFLPLP